MTASVVVGQTIELREEPRQFIVSSQSSDYPTKSMAFASDDDEPPAYINDLPHHTRDQFSRTRSQQDGDWRNLNAASPVYSLSPSLGCDRSLYAQTAEVPLRPNRRRDPEFGRENASPVSRVLLPVSASIKRPRRAKSSGGNSGKHNWLKNIKSPIGEPHTCLHCLSLWCADRCFV